MVASLQREDIFPGPLPIDRVVGEGEPTIVLPWDHIAQNQVAQQVAQSLPTHRARYDEAEGLLTLGPGQVAGLSGLPGSGLTRLGLSLIAPYASQGALACIDVRGWFSPAVAWDLGIEPDRLVVVRSSDFVTWGRIVATLLGGLRGVYAEVPPGIKDASLRKLVAKARTQRTPLVLRPIVGDLPKGIAHLHLRARGVAWEGTDAGHGRLTVRRTILDASGKSTRGMERTIEVEDGEGSRTIRNDLWPASRELRTAN